MNAHLEKLYYTAPKVLQNQLVSIIGWRQWKKRYGAGFAERITKIEKIDAMESGVLNQDIGYRIQMSVKHAVDKVPYYRDLFEEHSINPEDINSIAALDAIPPLEKDVLRAHPEKFCVDNAAAKTYALQLTSGSTGTPLAIRVDRETYQLTMALLLHHETLHGVPAGAARATFAGRMVQRATDMNPPFWRYNRSENQMIYSSYHLNSQTVEDYLQGLKKFDPNELIGYPSAIATLASLIKEGGYTPEFQPKLIVTNSETLLDWQRELICEVFNAPVFDTYGTAECLVFGWDSQDPGYRLHSSLGIAQTVDQNNHSVFETPGDLLCTTLSNRIMPLIRFRIGDVAVMADPASHPEFGGQVLRRIEGRIDDVVITPDGRRIGRLDHVFKGVDGIRECQIIQHGLADFEFVVAPADNYSDSVLTLIAKNLNHRMGCECNIKTSIVDRGPSGENGKFRGVVSRV